MKCPKTGASKGFKQAVKPHYDTSSKKYATATRLYKVGEVFYYRRKIKGKLFRISLRTKDIKIALYRKKLIDLIQGEELFKLKQGDYELIFEYDSVEELKEILEATKATQEQIEQNIAQFQQANESIEKNSRNIQPEYGIELRWADLEIKFVEAKRKAGKVSKSTYKAYASTFNKLNEFFRSKRLDNLTIEDYEEFREYLKKKYKLKNKTINNHMKYVNSFLEFGVNRQLLKFNQVKTLESLKEEESPKKNFTDTDIQKILNYSFEEKNVKTFCTIAIYTGMRLHEIHNLNNKDIKQDSEGIYYFDINKSKTKSGIRKVPIHKKILNEILETDFPIFKDKTTDAVQKAVNRQLKKIINEKGKTFHSFRGTFISKAVDKNPEKVVVVQEVVGHSKSDKDRLTLDTYAKGFSLQLKKEIVDSVEYF